MNINCIGTAGEYMGGSMSNECFNEKTQTYFALDIPGDNCFKSTNNLLCASKATMFKVGSKATIIDVGSYPDVAKLAVLMGLHQHHVTTIVSILGPIRKFLNRNKR